MSNRLTKGTEQSPLVAECKTLRQSLVEAKDKHDDVEQKNYHLKQQIKTLQLSLATSEAKVAEVKPDVKRARFEDQNYVQRSVFTAFQEKAASVARQLCDRVNERDENITKLNDQLMAKDNQVEKLKEDNDVGKWE